MIIGHLGEMLPFAAYRIDRYYGLGATRRIAGCNICRRRTCVTTSTSRPAATSVRRHSACTLEVMGPDRVMFSVDYPMDNNQDGVEFLRGVSDGRRHAP